MSDNDTKVMEDVNIKAIGTKDKKSFVLFLQLFYKSKNSLKLEKDFRGGLLMIEEFPDCL